MMFIHIIPAIPNSDKQLVLYSPSQKTMEIPFNSKQNWWEIFLYFFLTSSPVNNQQHLAIWPDDRSGLPNSPV